MHVQILSLLLVQSIIGAKLNNPSFWLAGGAKRDAPSASSIKRDTSISFLLTSSVNRNAPATQLASRTKRNAPNAPSMSLLFTSSVNRNAPATQSASKTNGKAPATQSASRTNRDTPPLTLLCSAIGDLARITSLLPSVPNLDDRCNGTTPLILAITRKLPATIKLLLANGVSVTAMGDDGSTPLHAAVKSNMVEAATWLLDKGAFIDAKSIRSAVEHGHGEMLELFFARPDRMLLSFSRQDTTLVTVALQAKHYSVVKLLLTRQMTLNPSAQDWNWNNGLATTDAMKWTPLHVASHFGSVETARLFLGNNVNAIDHDGQTALHLAAQNGHLTLVTLLLDRGADGSITDAKRQSPLTLAVRNGHFKIAELLICRTRAPCGAPLLFTAIEHDHLDVLQLLIANGGNVHTAAHGGRTFLHYASIYRRPACIALLVKHGVSVTAVDRDGCTALHYVAESDMVDMAALLLDHGADVAVVDHDGNAPLHHAAQFGSARMATLLAQRASVMFNKHGQTPLELAAVYRNFDVVKTLLLCDFMLVGHAGMHLRWTTGHMEAYYGGETDTEALRLYQDARDVMGRTPLHCTAYHGKVKAALVLLDGGAAVDAIDRDGMTALHMAARHGHLELVKLLLARGADMDLFDAARQTPFMIAKLHGTAELFLPVAASAPSTEEEETDTAIAAETFSPEPPAAAPSEMTALNAEPPAVTSSPSTAAAAPSEMTALNAKATAVTSPSSPAESSSSATNTDSCDSIVHEISVADTAPATSAEAALSDDESTGDEESPTADDESPTADDESPTADEESPTADEESPTADSDHQDWPIDGTLASSLICIRVVQSEDDERSAGHDDYEIVSDSSFDSCDVAETLPDQEFVLVNQIGK